MKDSKFLEYIGLAFFAVLFFWLFGSAYGLFNNLVSEAAHKATGVQKFFGTFFLLIGIGSYAGYWLDLLPASIYDRINGVAIHWALFFLLLLSLVFLTGGYEGVY